jgi:hypothetical protein
MGPRFRSVFPFGPLLRSNIRKGFMAINPLCRGRLFVFGFYSWWAQASVPVYLDCVGVDPRVYPDFGILFYGGDGRLCPDVISSEPCDERSSQPAIYLYGRQQT